MYRLKTLKKKKKFAYMFVLYLISGFNDSKSVTGRIWSSHSMSEKKKTPKLYSKTHKCAVAFIYIIKKIM